MAPALGGTPRRTPRGPQGEGMQTSLPASSPSIPAQALERGGTQHSTASLLHPL